MIILSGKTQQRVIEVRQFDHAKQRALVVCYPDMTPRWVSLRKPQRMTSCPK